MVRQPVIAYKFSSDGRINVIIHCGVSPHVISFCPCIPGFVPLLLHTILEPFFINREPFLFQDLLGQVQREPIGVIQLKCIFARQHLPPGLCHFLLHLCQDAQPLVNGLVKLLLLLGQHLKDKFLLLLQLRIPILTLCNHGSAQSSQELPSDPQQPAMACRTADQAAQHIPTPFIAGHNAIRNHKSRRTHMVCDQPDGHVIQRICLVRFP